MLNAIEKVNADVIYILPNNKNIILAAEQAKSLVEDKKIFVVRPGPYRRVSRLSSTFSRIFTGGKP